MVTSPVWDKPQLWYSSPTWKGLLAHLLPYKLSWPGLGDLGVSHMLGQGALENPNLPMNNASQWW